MCSAVLKDLLPSQEGEVDVSNRRGEQEHPHWNWKSESREGVTKGTLAVRKALPKRWPWSRTTAPSVVSGEIGAMSHEGAARGPSATGVAVCQRVVAGATGSLAKAGP